MVVSGMRESEQPIQRILGDWPWDRVGRRSGFWVEICLAQDLLLARQAPKWSVVLGLDILMGGAGCGLVDGVWRVGLENGKMDLGR